MEHMVNFIKMYLILWKTIYIGFKPQFRSKKLMGNTSDFIMNIFNLMEIPSTKLDLCTVIATKLNVNSALQTFDMLIGNTINLYIFQSMWCRVSPTDDYVSLRLKHVVERMFSLAS